MAAAGQVSLGLRGDFEIVIGSKPTCKICVPNVPGIAPEHAVLKRVGDRLFIKDCGSNEGTYINGKRLKRHMVEITRHDSLTICNIPIGISPKLFLGRDRVGVESSLLRFEIPRGVLCDGMFVSASPGTLTAVMGPSGSGKSVLLGLINGYTKPTDGHVIIGGQFDLHREYSTIRDFLGYVPQDDVMIPQLTVRQSLDYRLRLRFPDMDTSVRKKLIEETCSRLGFKDDRLKRFLDTQIGSSESGIRGLSGGERRRANIAHELITKPLILILDEPTSGLSSVDSDHIIQLLHDLAKQDGLTVIATIHQPSRDAFAHFDNLLLVDYGGQLAYYGPGADVGNYFRAAAGVNCGQKNPAEFVLEILDDRQGVNKDKRLVAQFEQYQRQGRSPLKPLPPPVPGAPGAPSVPVKSGKPSSSSAAKQKHASVISQLKILLRRNIRVLCTDKINLLMVVGQVPIIVLLMFLGFYKFWYDEKSFDQFARKVFFFHQLKEPYIQENKSVPIDSLTEKADNMAGDEKFMVSQATGSRRGSIFFLLVASSIWFGIMGACKEVVSEQHILKREVRSCIHFFPYLSAKMLTLVLVVGVQTLLLTMLLVPLLLKLSIVATVFLWFILWLAAAVSAAMGLLVSCTFKSFHVVLTLVPLLVIPQLLFGGLLRPQVVADQATWWPKITSAFTIQRWAFEPALQVDTYAKGGVLTQDFAKAAQDKYSELNIVKFQDKGITNQFFHERWYGHVVPPILFLLFAFAAFVFASDRMLRHRMNKGTL